MFCCNCGKKIDERALERRASSYALPLDKEITSTTDVVYLCPRCGHTIHAGISAEETKGLTRAAHAELQRGRNAFASGMGNVSIGLILLVIAVIFLLLSYKPSAPATDPLVTNCPEFYVCIALFALSGILLILGIVYVAIGLFKKVRYTHLLKDISNRTFVQ